MTKLDPELRRGVQEYLTEMNATKSERADVWYWVHHGVDIYDNPWFYYNDAGGRQISLLLSGWTTTAWRNTRQ